MAYLDKEFSSFYEDIKIKEESAVLREKRDLLKSAIEKYLPNELKSIGINVNKSDFEFINQGSYSIGTTIKNPYGGVDLDYAVILPINIADNDDTRKIKKAVKNSLSHVNARTVNIKEPCVTVSYCESEEEKIHIDFPVYAKDNSLLYLARGKEFSDDYKWEIADPKGLNSFFKDRLKEQEQLRRIIRFLKKWKQEKYKNNTNNNAVPPSVALTILACNYYKYDEHDIVSLYNTLKLIKDEFTVIKDSDDNITYINLSCYLPVTPYSDVLYKMRNSNLHLISFYNKMCTAVSNMETAINLEDDHEAGQYMQKVLGSDFEIPEKVSKSSYTQYHRESSFG